MHAVQYRDFPGSLKRLILELEAQQIHLLTLSAMQRQGVASVQVTPVSAGQSHFALRERLAAWASRYPIVPAAPQGPARPISATIVCEEVRDIFDETGRESGLAWFLRAASVLAPTGLATFEAFRDGFQTNITAQLESQAEARVLAAHLRAWAGLTRVYLIRSLRDAA